MTLNSSNKMLKITQFNSGLVLKERKVVPVSHSASPYKHFALKKVKDLPCKVIDDTDKMMEI